MKKASMLAGVFLMLLVGASANATEEIRQSDFTNQELENHYKDILGKDFNLKGKEDCNKLLNKLGLINQSNNMTKRSGSFYSETLIGYDPDYATEEPEAFPLIKVYFNNTGGNYDDGIELTYKSSKSVSWEQNFSSKVEADLTVPIINKGIKSEFGYSVARSSSTSDCFGTRTMVKNLKHKKGYVSVYAPGIKTSGAAVYEWDDVEGNSGISKIPVGGSALLPFSEYEFGGITFGSPKYR